jgi:hypothetical protein
LYWGGGGGGAGSVGTSENTTPFGYSGGTGAVSSITGTPTQYAGGGAGGVYDANNVGFKTLGGGGGGGNGGSGTGSGALLFTATSGFSNTGGGGGGSGNYASSKVGAAGGSGIVILRYPSYLAPATSTTGSPETYVSGNYRVYKFVASGTITF